MIEKEAETKEVDQIDESLFEEDLSDLDIEDESDGQIIVVYKYCYCCVVLK